MYLKNDITPLRFLTCICTGNERDLPETATAISALHHSPNLKSLYGGYLRDCPCVRNKTGKRFCFFLSMTQASESKQEMITCLSPLNFNSVCVQERFIESRIITKYWPYQALSSKIAAAMLGTGGLTSRIVSK